MSWKGYQHGRPPLYCICSPVWPILNECWVHLRLFSSCFVEGETFCPCGSSFFVFLEPDCPSFLPGECRRWQLFFLHPQPKSIADNVSITKSELNFKDILRLLRVMSQMRDCFLGIRWRRRQRMRRGLGGLFVRPCRIRSLFMYIWVGWVLLLLFL